MNRLFSRLTAFSPTILSLVRIVVGLIFMLHGTQKLFGLPPSPGMPAMFSFMWFGGLIEFVGGGLVLLGLFTRYAAFVVSGQMAVAYFMFHASKNIYPTLNGGDAAILYCFIFFYFVFAGPGPISLDAMRRGR